MMAVSNIDEALESLHTFFNVRKISVFERIAILEIFKTLMMDALKKSSVDAVEVRKGLEVVKEEEED